MIRAYRNASQVMSGQLYAPRVPVVAENEEMKKLVDTYGKTWHMWQVDREDPLPLGASPFHTLHCIAIVISAVQWSSSSMPSC